MEKKGLCPRAAFHSNMNCSMFMRERSSHIYYMIEALQHNNGHNIRVDVLLHEMLLK